MKKFKIQNNPLFTLISGFAGKYIDFVSTKIAYELDRKPLGFDTKNKGADIELYKNGIVVLPNFFSTEEISIFKKSIPNEKYSPTPEMQHSYNNPLADKFIPNADTITGLEGFFQNSDIERIVKSYFSSTAIPGKSFVRSKKDTGPTASFENFWHFDSIKNRIKVFLYLGNVTEKNAPVAYMTGTHKTGLWRLRKEIEMHVGYIKDDQGYAKDDIAGYIGCFWPHEAVKLMNDYNFIEKIVTGGPGTVIIFDAKGLHKATQLIEGEREILMSHWYLPNHHT